MKQNIWENTLYIPDDEELKHLKNQFEENPLEQTLPTFLKNDIEALIKGYEEKPLHLDCLFNEVQGSINSARVDRQITEEQADYLWSTYLFLE
jgi:hypothetical protein